ncbi:hypothetical protein M2323_000351 [Rhodoblastus acidophilus]|uniref:hypothetical protein n=1 Tax=Rhodoblastus acidophilus TaxID=1074 RepID=UPI002224D939|nr:hypothetical protein [Rhodoblastus acidophilus]MCW2282590.1 hypothetical protein [Rhodoblastus acidophilus]MCW2331451.1 hypothetical protein [Rhodoblastus acidophilus]
MKISVCGDGRRLRGIAKRLRSRLATNGKDIGVLESRNLVARMFGYLDVHHASFARWDDEQAPLDGFASPEVEETRRAHYVDVLVEWGLDEDEARQVVHDIGPSRREVWRAGRRRKPILADVFCKDSEAQPLDAGAQGDQPPVVPNRNLFAPTRATRAKIAGEMRWVLDACPAGFPGVTNAGCWVAIDADTRLLLDVYIRSDDRANDEVNFLRHLLVKFGCPRQLFVDYALWCSEEFRDAVVRQGIDLFVGTKPWAEIAERVLLREIRRARYRE